MNIQTTKALVPVQGSIQPIPNIVHKDIEQYNDQKRHQDRIFSGVYNSYDRVNNIYGRFGKEVENQSLLGANVDLYV